jgi:hypothetical protein
VAKSSLIPPALERSKVERSGARPPRRPFVDPGFNFTGFRGISAPKRSVLVYLLRPPARGLRFLFSTARGIMRRRIRPAFAESRSARRNAAASLDLSADITFR